MLGTVDCSEASDFNPRSPYGERRDQPLFRIRLDDFNPRSPYGERPPPNAQVIASSTISIHAPLTGSDHLARLEYHPLHYFNPRSPYGERPWIRSDRPDLMDISIHAPLTGSDFLPPTNAERRKYFNPRSPYGERRTKISVISFKLLFQSTLPLRGATMGSNGTDRVGMISIHAPLTGSDGYLFADGEIADVFQSTLPLRGATAALRSFYSFWSYFNPRSPYGERPALSEYRRVMLYFNPRSPYGERRYTGKKVEREMYNFNPRSPYGERPGMTIKILGPFRFQSTLPLRGATPTSKDWKRWRLFQSTLPLRGATIKKVCPIGHTGNFNPRSPYGERPCLLIDCKIQV